MRTLLAWAVVALTAAAVMSAEQAADLSPSMHSAEQQIVLLDHSEGDVQLLHDGDLGQPAGDSGDVTPGQEAQTNATDPSPLANVSDPDASISSANPFVDAGQGPSGTGNTTDAIDATTGVEQQKRTLDQTQTEEAEDAEKAREEDHKKNVMQEHLDVSGKQPLHLAGKSGAAAECVVKDDSVEVSGRGESACLFMAKQIYHSEHTVEVAFDLEFGNPVSGASGGRHGGVFFGASQNSDSRAGNPTVEWSDRKSGKGYRVYGNKDINKLYGMNNGPKPNKRWRITLMPDGTADFTAGPKTWVHGFTPLLKGPYIGFFTVGTKLKITNFSVRKASSKDRASSKHSAKPVNGLHIQSEEGFGTGTAELFYSETGGDFGRIAPKAVYLRGSTLHPTDLRTMATQPGDVGGNVASTQDLTAGRFLEIQAAEGFREESSDEGFRSSTRMFFIGQGKGRLKSQSLYLADGNFQSEEGSIIAGRNVVAEKRLLIGASEEHGKPSNSDAEDAEFWYAQIGSQEEKVDANTVYLRKGHFATEDGDVVGGNSIVASEYLVLDADKTSGGSAKFWFSQTGGDEFEKETVYLQKGDLSTFTGDIVSKGDVVVKRNLRIGARKFYGDGEGKLFYISRGSGKLTSNTLYVSGSLATEKGSIEAKKDLVTNRYLLVGTGGAKSLTGGAKLWYCHRTENQETSFNDKSLYLDAGDFRSQAGSIYASDDLVATKELFFSSFGDAFGGADAKARLWYAHKDSGDTIGNSLYLKDGDFATENGDIVSPENLVASKYIEVNAFPGFAQISTDSAQLYYSSKPRDGTTESVLFLKKGDFRLEKGSLYSKEFSASGKISVNAMEGYGTGTASFFYIDTPFGESTLSRKSLYLKGKVDFHVANNIYSKEHLVAKRSVMVEARKGFGSGAAELWYGKKGGRSGELKKEGYAETLYLKDGTFATEKGDLMASDDIETVSGEIKIAMREESGQLKPATPDLAELWYSAVGNAPVIASKSLYLRKGNFATMTGNIGSDKNVRAHAKVGSLKGKKVQLKDTMHCNSCELGKIYILPTSQQTPVSPHEKPPLHKAPDATSQPRNPSTPKTVLEESMVLLDETSPGGQKAIDVEVALRKLTQRHEELRDEESQLTKLLEHAKGRLGALEGKLRARLR